MRTARYLLIFLLFSFTVQAGAYKCKDSNGRISYQDTACPGRMVGAVKDAPSVSAEDQKQAQSRVDNIIANQRREDSQLAREMKKQQKQEEEDKSSARINQAYKKYFDKWGRGKVNNDKN